MKWNVAVDDSAGASLAECAEGKLYLNVLKLLFIQKIYYLGRYFEAPISV